MKKIFTRLLLVFFLIVVYMYALVISNLPDELIVFQGENISIKTLLGLSVQQGDTVEASSNNGQTSITANPGKTSIKVSLFDKFLIKNVNVDVLPKTKVIPVGTIAGVKLYTSGVLVVGMSEIEGVDNQKYKPYENTGINEGDRIIKINEMPISTTEELIQSVNSSNGQSIEIEYVHEDETKECSITPTQTAQNEYKLGLWVRDSAAGVGTVTFYDPQTKSFGALGHGITDIDTEQLINIASGEFVTTRILNITKGEER